MLAAKHTFSAIGTAWTIETATPLSRQEIGRIYNVIESFDHTYSRFRDDSLVRQMYDLSGNEPIEFPDTIRSLWKLYDQLHTLSDGCINPLVGKSLESIGYDASYSLKFKGYTPAPPFSSVVLNNNSLCSRAPVLIDIGAIGKGLIVDIVADCVALAHQQYVVDASGDMRISTNTAEIIGLEHPEYVDEVIGTLRLYSGAICASATNRRAWGEGLHHVIDARTGMPVKTTIVATWAIASSAMKADGLATGLFFVDGQTLVKNIEPFHYVVLHKNGHIEHNLKKEVGELFS